MKIDREHVKNTFRKYTNAYDSTNVKIKLKIAHTYRVAGLCEQIARSENLPAEEVELAWLLGMLHDVGRFEQVRRYDTFLLPAELDARTEKFCHVLRDADKIDILRVKTEVPMEEIYNTTIEEVQSAVVTKAVMDNFFTHRATPRQIKQNPVDHLVGGISLVYDLVFSESFRIVENDGYLEQLLQFESQNPQTQKQFNALRREMEHYLKERLLQRSL